MTRGGASSDPEPAGRQSFDLIGLVEDSKKDSKADHEAEASHCVCRLLKFGIDFDLV